MKLAFFCSEYPAISHTFVLREIESLRRAGVEIDTFSIRTTPPEKLLSERDRRAAASTFSILPPRLGVLGAHLRLAVRSPGAYARTLRHALRLAPPGLRGRIWQAFYFAEAVVLLRQLERRGIRHVHVHLANAAADVALLAAHLGTALDPARPLTWSFTMHGPTEFADLRHYRLAEKLAGAEFVVCISDFARSQLMAISPPETWDRLRVVHVGIPVRSFTRSGPPPTAAGPTRILYIGRLVPEKGQSVLLEAAAALVREGRDIGVTLAGEGALRPGLESLAARLGIGDRVEFPGAVGQDQLHGLYERASIFCLPSFGEGVPVVLMEAMAMEVPTISTRIAGIPELIEDDVGGILTPPGRTDRLAEAIAAVIDDPGLGRRLGAAGRAKVLAEFDCETSAAQLRAVFEEMLGDGQPSPPAIAADSQATISNAGA